MLPDTPDMPDMPGEHLHGVPGSKWATPPGRWPTNLDQVPYASFAIPGSTTPPSWLQGSNCQRFAYGVLSLFGLVCPPLRSSELWDDVAATVAVAEPRPLDLVLFNFTDCPFGAHVGVWMAPDEIFHLCEEVGRPATWPLAAFSARSRYATLIGFKRVVPTS